jgi:LysR family transcriptional activator of nhaA
MLNYHHLQYFWTVVREGSVTKAAATLDVSQPTVSVQLAALEKQVGQKLFQREGRGLHLTGPGQLVFEYADEIFRLGGELLASVRDNRARTPKLVVGIVDVLPKVVVYRLLQPVLQFPAAARLVFVENQPERLLAELALHNIDLVLTDSPNTSSTRIKAYHHLLGESGTTFFATPTLAAKLRPDFPKSLNGNPMLLPAEGSAIRRALNQWLEEEKLDPVIRGEFADSALMKVFGQAGIGVLPLPTVIEHDVAELFGMEVVGHVERVRSRFYAATVQRKLRNPAVVKICEAARQELFG